VVGHRHRPALGHCRGDQQELELRNRAGSHRASAQRIGGEATRRHGVDRALVRNHRDHIRLITFGRHDDRGGGRVRIAVHIGGPVQQLGGRDVLRNQPEKRQLNVAAAEHRAGPGMLETRRWVVERVVRGELRTGAPLQFFVLRLPNPLGAG
jgi:hypothetical protein